MRSSSNHVIGSMATVSGFDATATRAEGHGAKGPPSGPRSLVTRSGAPEHRSMRALIVYESMYGNTRAIAERIAAGVGDRFDVTTVAVASVSQPDVAMTDLIVCGA